MKDKIQEQEIIDAYLKSTKGMFKKKREIIL
jgi:hypothetical protein